MRFLKTALLPVLLVCSGVHAQPFLKETPSSAHISEPTTEIRESWNWGMGWFHYKEPGLMQLMGPELSLEMRHKPQKRGWPDQLQAEAGAGLLRYTSQNTGNLDHVPYLGGRANALWRFHARSGSVWHAGLQLDLNWTDLRGHTRVGNQTYQGYRRMGSKLWAIVQHDHMDGHSTQVGALLRGRQDSFLSDVGYRHITNTQRQGFLIAYQHSSISSSVQLRPWIRYVLVDDSDLDGPFYEPRNQLLQAGLLLRF